MLSPKITMEPFSGYTLSIKNHIVVLSLPHVVVFNTKGFKMASYLKFLNI